MNKNTTQIPRERRLILDCSPCDLNLYPDGPRTIAEAKKIGRSLCPYFEKCQRGHNTESGWGCVMSYAVDVAKYVVKQGNSVSSEVHGDFKGFFGSCNPPEGFVYSVDRKTFVFIKNETEALQKIEEFASQVVGTIEPSMVSNQSVGPGFNDVLQHAATPEGIDLRKMEELEGRFGHLPGRSRRCDVLHGPCACGAWH